MPRTHAPLVAAFAAMLVAGAARADIPPGPPPRPPVTEKAICVWKTVHAIEHGDGTMDPKITMLREDLKKPPFTAWKTFKMIDRKEQELVEGGTANFSTPDGRTVALTFAGHEIKDGQHFIRAVLDFRGATSNARTTFRLAEKGHVVVAGHKYQGGVLIYALSCQTEK